MTSENIGHASTSFYSYLENIVQRHSHGLKAAVAKTLLDQTEDEDMLQSTMKDLAEHGCISGMIGHLVCYKDTHAFYDKYYEDIEDLRHEYYENTGIPLHIDGDLKNDMAWYAFEYTADELYTEWDTEE